MGNIPMWYNITKSYNRVPYKQGSFDIKAGLDCISMILLFMQDLGKDVSGWIDGSRKFQYKDLLLSSKDFVQHLINDKETSMMLKEFIKSNCDKVNKRLKGDIIYFNYRDVEIVGIYIGQNNIMCCFEGLGIKVIKIKKYNVLEIYRWV